LARILLSAYACEPNRGSEPAVGWSWAIELSRLGHQVWVLTRTGNRTSIERKAHRDFDFIYYDLPRWMQSWRTGFAGKRLYYVLWQWCAARHIRKLFPEMPFDVVQHVTYVSARYPSFMGSLGIPFYFGPVSGGEKVPPKLRRDFSVQERWRAWLRDLSNCLIPFDPLLRKTFRRAQKIIVTRDTVWLIPRQWRHKCEVRLAVGLTGEYLNDANVGQFQSCSVLVEQAFRPALATAYISPRGFSPCSRAEATEVMWEGVDAALKRRSTRTIRGHANCGTAIASHRGGRCFRLLYAGRLLESKGVDLALRAVHQLRQWRHDVRFTVVGDGPERSRLAKLAEKLGLAEAVEWVGCVSRHSVEDHYRMADLFLFPSLCDSGAMAVLEAMAHGLPVVCMKLGGPGEMVNESCGRVVPALGENREELATSCAEAVREIMTTPGLQEYLSAGARRRAREFDFQNLVRSIHPRSPYPAINDNHVYSLQLSALVPPDAAV